MADQQTTGQTRTGGWLNGSVDPERLEHLVDHAEDLEQTKTSYLLVLILGMVAGLAVPVGLLVASL